ncbi:MAG: hypothetical protein ABSF33_04690 [Acidimicrobiales bacterium]
MSVYSPARAVESENSLAMGGVLLAVFAAIGFVVWMVLPGSTFDMAIVCLAGVLVGMSIGLGIAAQVVLKSSDGSGGATLPLTAIVVGVMVATGMFVGCWWILSSGYSP